MVVIDIDLVGLNSVIFYFIVSGNVESKFEIDISGLLKFSVILDVEIIKIYMLMVVVIDVGILFLIGIIIVLL